MRCVFTDLRDGLLLVDFPGVSDESANLQAVSLARALSPLFSRGLRDAIPAARTLLLSFDPRRLPHAAVRRAAEQARPGSAATGTHPSRTLEIPVAFDGEDLSDLAAGAGLSPTAWIDAYLAAEYRVAFLGFSPGFAYMTGLPERLRAARLATPRLRVPPGSVAIAGGYTGVYPSATPGGWRLIGRTPARPFDPRRRPPVLFAAGDRVRFVAGAPVASPSEAPRPAPKGDALFRIVKAGLWTAVVGAPRLGMAASGVPPGGPMDPRSAALANVAAGNAPSAGALEIALDGPELEFLAPCLGAVSGADLPVLCGGTPRAHGQRFALAAGDRLTFGRTRKAMRTYLAVGGGLRDAEAEETWQTRRLQRGDVVLRAEPPSAETSPRGADAETELLAGAPITLRALAGPHAAMFTAASLRAFFAGEWRVSPQSDRRGVRLTGTPLEHAGPAEVEPVGAAPGSVQVPGGGLPIVLGPDGPVTGGYPRIATVIGADLFLLGRAAPGDTLRFVPVTLAEALAASAAAGEYD